ncbi:hypothetical protein GCM10028817_04300 [Spirosoma pomorum]
MLLLLLAVTAGLAQTTLVQWNFNSNPPDNAASTGTTAPSTGVGSLTTVGGTTSSFASASGTSGSSDPTSVSADNSGYNITGFPAATLRNKTAGIEFRTSTTGFQSLTISWDQRFSNTAANRSRLQYSVDGGTNYTDVANPFTVSAGDRFYNGNVYDLSGITEVNNRTDVRFRIVAEFSTPTSNPTSYTAATSTSTYGTSGTWRFDMVTVRGTALATPQPDLTVALSGPASATTGQPFAYTLVANNTGDAAATNVPLSFTLPAGITYVGAGVANSFTASETGGVVLFTGGQLTPGTSATLTVTGSAQNSGSITATPGSAVIDPGNTIAESNETNNSSIATITTTVGATNQAPVAPVIGDQTATVGQSFSYTVPVFTDPENQTLTYTATINPANGLTFDPATRVISGQPTTTGVSSVTVMATDPGSLFAAATFSLSVNAAPAGQIRITEYMYNGTPGEYVELTNVGNAPVDLTGWSYDDNSRTAGSFSLSGFGVVQPGESVVFTESDASVFRTAWYLPTSVKVVGGSNQGLGRSDEINIYDATGTLVDRLTYNDQGIAGSVRTADVSGWVERANLGQNLAVSYKLSAVADAQNSYSATTGNLGNPGGYFIPLNRVLVVESAGNTRVAEGGATDTYTIALNSRPAADVTVTINAGSQLTTTPAALTFTPTSYSTAQIVTVAAIDDNLVEGIHTAQVTHSTNSTDQAYNGIATNPVSVTITDNDNPATVAPTIQVATSTTSYLSLSATGAGYVSGVINDPTDPAATLGINFTLADSDSPISSLTVTASSSNSAVVSTLALMGTDAARNLKITPVGVGYSTITLTVTDGANRGTYIINYAASAASVTPAATRFHTGTSDASTAIRIDENHTLVADDENQVIRLYNRQNSGLPVAGFDFTSSLALTDISGGVPREVDMEASTRLGNRIFWMGSQSNADGGNNRPNRNRVFATDVAGTGAATTLTYVGRYDYLRNDIIAWDVNNSHGKGANYYGLAASGTAGVGSKQATGYNIEGVELAPDNATAYVAFRAPQVPPTDRRNALIIPVTNFTTLPVSSNGGTQGSATFGAPIELDLGGRGIREMRKNANNEYIIIAGAAGDAGAAPNDFRLYTWTGNAADAPMARTANLTALNANGSFESIVDVPSPLTDASSIQLLVDNGDAVYYNDGVIAKELNQNNFKKFRSEVVVLGAAPNTPPTVANAIVPQSATVGQAYTLSLAGVFADAQTPGQLTLSVRGLPAGLSFVAPATISGTPSVSGVNTVAVTAADPGNLSASTSFTLTVNPASTTPPTQPFALTGVTSASCESVSAGVRQVSFVPQYTGLTGEPVSFSVANELAPTTSGGPYSLRLYTDNPVITLVARQGEVVSQFNYNWLANCGNVTPGNTPPTVANAIAPQSATAGQAYTLPLTNVFTDAQTPGQLTLSVSGLPAGLSFVAPATISGTPSVSGVSTIAVTATDPGSLSASTSFTLTVSPASTTPPTQPFALTGVTSVSCESVSAGVRQISFAPQYTGLSGEPVSFSVTNELAPTNSAGPYSLRLYTDNPVITLVARQGEVVSQFSYNWLANCGNVTPGNTPPTVANAIALQNATVGQAYTLSLANVFTDAQTPNQLTLSVSGLPAGLSFVAPTTISGTPSMSGISTITLTATDPGNLSASTSFTLTVSPASTTPPTQPFALTGVTSVSCESVSAGVRQVSFVPQYTGLTGEPVSFSVANELAPTTSGGPYSLRLYTDNSVITLVARQGEVVSQFSYNWLGNCGSGNARLTAESMENLSVLVLGNPTPAETVDVEIQGVADQTVQFQLVNSQGQVMSEQTIEKANTLERATFRLGKTVGTYLLQVSTLTQKQTVKIVKQ